MTRLGLLTIGATGALAVVAPPAFGSISARTAEVMMVATVREAAGGGTLRLNPQQGTEVVRHFILSELPDFALLPGATFVLGWRASGEGMEEFFGEDGFPLCQPYLFAGVTPGPAASACTNDEAAAIVLFSSIPFADSLPDQPVAQGPKVYLYDYSLDLVYVPTAFWSPACCAYAYDRRTDSFAKLDEPGRFRHTGEPHFATGWFENGEGWLDYRFDLAGLDGGMIVGEGRALIWFDVVWRYRNYFPTGLPAPSGLALMAMGLAALTGRRARA